MSSINIKDWLMGLSESRETKPNSNFSFQSSGWAEEPLVNRETALSWLEIFKINEEIQPDFIIEKSSTHDGTLIFVTELFLYILNSVGEEIIKFLEKQGKENVKIKEILITNIKHDTVFLNKVSEEKSWPGQKDTMKIGVKLTYAN